MKRTATTFGKLAIGDRFWWRDSSSGAPHTKAESTLACDVIGRHCNVKQAARVWIEEQLQ